VIRAAAVAIAISTTLNAVGVFTEEDIHWVNLFMGFASAVIAAAVVFGVVVRRVMHEPRRAAWWGVVFGALGIVTVVAFWSGLPPVFGVAAIYLGRTVQTRSYPALAATALGIVALVADVVAYATDVASRY
jgi:hypothetical protein